MRIYTEICKSAALRNVSYRMLYVHILEHANLVEQSYLVLSAGLYDLNSESFMKESFIHRQMIFDDMPVVYIIQA